MRRVRPAAWAAVAAVVVALAVAGPAAASYPDPDDVPYTHALPCLETYDRRFVFDYTGQLELAWAAEVEGAACEVYRITSAHVALVLVPTTDGLDLDTYAVELFERWGLGDDDRDDGALLLYTAQGAGGDAEVRLEVGYGLTGTLTTLAARTTIDAVVDGYNAALDAGDDDAAALSYGLAKGMQVVLTKLVEDYDEGFPSPPKDRSLWDRVDWRIAVVVAVCFLAAIGGATRSRGGWGYRSNQAAWTGVLASLFLPRRPGGGMGGFGGGGFGGGRSGGGGLGRKF